MRPHISLFVIIPLLVSSCFFSPPNETREEVTLVPEDPIEKTRYYITFRQTQQALETVNALLEQQPNNATALYLKGQIYGQQGEVDLALDFYKKALQVKADYHASYNVSREILAIKETEVEEKIKKYKSEKQSYIHGGEGNLKLIAQQLEQAYRQQAKIYLQEGEAYLLYQNPEQNVLDFPDLEANLRDTQDVLRDLLAETAQERKNYQKISDPLFQELLEIRSKISKKHILSLLDLSERYLHADNLEKSISLLKEADSQISKFFVREKSFVKTLPLISGQGVIKLYDRLYQKLSEYLWQHLNILVRNRHKFQELRLVSEAQDQNKQIEQTAESLVQLSITYISRKQNIAKSKAEHHPQMIATYQKILRNIPQSSKKSDYHYRLAETYLQAKNYEKARKHINIAKKELGAYRIERFLRKLEAKEQSSKNP